MFYMSCAIMFLRSLFGEQQITESCYSAVYANQDDDVMKATLADLNRDSPKIRLVLSTSVSGMGFDPPSVTRVVHVCPLVEGSVRTGAGNCQEFVFLPYEIKFSFSRHLGFKS
jgi:hypothetical protein